MPERRESPHRSRVMLRFSLRFVFLAVTVLCIWLGMHVQSARKQKKAVETIRAAGGTVHYCGWKDGFMVRGGKPWAPKWMTDTFGEDMFHPVVAANVSALFHHAYNDQGRYTSHDPEATIDDKTWRAIEDLQSLQYLTLNARNISDDELRHLSGLTRLEELNIEAAPIDGTGLRHLAPLRRLGILSLHHVHLREENLHWLAELQRLEALGLHDTTISPAAADKLQKQLPACKIYHTPWPPRE